MNEAQKSYLDWLRGISAQMVLVGHLYVWMFHRQMIVYQNLGVVIFFILSGFLITYTTMVKTAQRPFRFRDYVHDRFFRIFTPFVPAILLVLVLDWTLLRHGIRTEYAPAFTLKNFIGNLLMLQHYPVGMVMEKLFHQTSLKIVPFGSARPFWTVAVEWWMYLFFGWLVLGSWRRRALKGSDFAIFGFLAIVPAFNIVSGPADCLTGIWFTGSLLGYLYFNHQEKINGIFLKLDRFKYLFLAILLGFLAVRAGWQDFLKTHENKVSFYDFVLDLILIALFFLGYGLCGAKGASSKRNKFAMFLADYSYSLYLVHYSIIVFILGFGWLGGYSPVAQFFILIAIGNAASILWWWLFERHHREVKAVCLRLLLKPARNA